MKQAAFQAKQVKQAVNRRANFVGKRWTDTCSDRDLGSDVGAYACAVYLNNLGSTGCAVSNTGTIMCQAEYDGIWTYVCCIFIFSILAIKSLILSMKSDAISPFRLADLP